MGDGFMASFASVTSAIQCAVALQRVLAARNAASPAGQALKIRIGINAGEPIRQKAIEAGASPLWASTPVFFVELLGGITVNMIYCLFMNYRNKTFSDYRFAREEGRLTVNYLFSFLI